MNKLVEYINKKTDKLLEEQEIKETKLFKEYTSTLDSLKKDIGKLPNTAWNNRYFKSLYILATNEASGVQYSLKNIDNWILICKKLQDIKEFKSIAKKMIDICEDIKKGKYDDLGVDYGIQKNVKASSDNEIHPVEGKFSVIHKFFSEFVKGYNESYKQLW